MKIKKAELWTPSGFLPCDIEMERDELCEECSKDLLNLFASLIQYRLDSVTILDNFTNQYVKLSTEDRKLVKVEIESGNVLVYGPEDWINKLISFDVLQELKVEDVLENRIDTIDLN